MDKKTVNRQIRSISNLSSLLLLVFFALVIPAQILLKYMSRTGGYDSVWQDSKFLWSITQAAVFVIAYPLLYLIFYKLLNRKHSLRLRDVFQKPLRSKGWILKWTVIAVGSSLLLQVVLGLFVKETRSGMQSFLTKNDPLGWIIYGVPIVILAPIFEELVFRATIFRNNEPVGQLLASVVTGIAFGLWHTNIAQVYFAALLGVFLCLIFAKTRSIYTVMFVHFVNNLLSFSMSFLKIQLGSILSAGDKVFMVQAMFHKQTVLAVLLTLIILIILSMIVAAPIMLTVQIVKKRKSFGLNKGIFEFGALKKTLVFMTAPLTVIVFVLMILMTFVF